MYLESLHDASAVGRRRYWDQQFVLAEIARRSPWNDCANLPILVPTASVQTHIGLVLLNAEFDSERNPAYIRQHSERCVKPTKRGELGASVPCVPKCRERFRTQSISTEVWWKRCSPQ